MNQTAQLIAKYQRYVLTFAALSLLLFLGATCFPQKQAQEKGYNPKIDPEGFVGKVDA